jgi:DNA-binding IclR family transcriptional regulator
MMGTLQIERRSVHNSGIISRDVGYTVNPDGGLAMQTVQSIDRAFQILEEVASDPGGISELSRRLGLPTSTVARLLATLERLGAVERMTDDNGYRIGSAIVTMAASIDPNQSLLAVAQPYMVDLVEQVAEAVGLSIPAGYDVHYIGQVDCANPVQVRDWTGVSLPMHVVPSGMVVLAHWPDEAIARYLSRKLDRYTPGSVTDPRLIRERIERVRDEDVSWMEEEFAEGISSVAAPLFNAAGVVVGALHSHGPTYRFPDEALRDIIAGRVRSTAQAISASLGYVA